MSTFRQPARACALDHVIALTPDLEATSALFEQLGFTLTPTAPHSDVLGTENRCVMLERGYIELLGVRRQTSANALLRERLARGGGWAGLAFATSDIEKTRQLLRGHCDLGSPLSFSRVLPDSAEPASFTILPVTSIGLTGLETFFCQHHSPHLLRRPADLRHPNGAQALAACRVAAMDVSAGRAFFDRIGAFSSQEIDLMDEPPDGDARIAHVTVIVANPADVRERAQRANLIARQTSDGIDLPAQPALAFPLRLIGEK